MLMIVSPQTRDQCRACACRCFPPFPKYLKSCGGLQGQRIPVRLADLLAGVYTSTLDEATEHAVRELLAVSKALSDESRLRALVAVKDGELCLCQIIQVLGLAPATVSKHMDILERAGLVQRRRQGKWRYYRLNDGGSPHAAMTALRWVFDLLGKDPQLSEDARKIRKVRRQDLVEVSACYRS
jgi:DNA-binding transcriptional ArsR family regulator